MGLWEISWLKVEGVKECVGIDKWIGTLHKYKYDIAVAARW
jgi:hypothetical protein